MNRVAKFWERVKVVATSAVTYITAAQTFIIIAADEISQVLAPEQAETVVRISVRILAFLGAVVGIIRRSIPAKPADRGLLTPPPKGDLLPD